MKKQLLTIAATVLAVSAMAQGTINFANSSTSLITSGGTAVPSSANGRVQFAWAPEGATVSPYVAGTSLSAWLSANPTLTVLATTPTVGIPVAGRFVGGSQTLATATAGANVQGFLIGWSGGTTAFASYDAALASGDASVRLGVTPMFIVDTGNPNALPVPEQPANLVNFTGLALAPVVPEPTSFALAGLGAAALLIFRRRR